MQDVGEAGAAAEEEDESSSEDDGSFLRRLATSGTSHRLARQRSRVLFAARLMAFIEITANAQ